MCFAIQTAGALWNCYFGQLLRDDSPFGQLVQLMKGAMAELFMQVHEQSLVGLQQWLIWSFWGNDVWHHSEIHDHSLRL